MRGRLYWIIWQISEFSSQQAARYPDYNFYKLDTSQIISLSHFINKFYCVIVYEPIDLNVLISSDFINLFY